MENFIEEMELQELDKFDVSNMEDIPQEIFEDKNINDLLKDFVENAKIQYDIDPVTIEEVNQLSFKLQVGFYGAYATIANGLYTIGARFKSDTSSGVNTIEHRDIKSIVDKFISQPGSFIILSNTIYKAINEALNGDSDDLGRVAVGLVKDGVSCIFNIGKFVDGIITAKYDLSLDGSTWLERLKTYYTTVGDINAYQPHYAYDLEKNTLTRYTRDLKGASEIPTNDSDDIVIKNLSPLNDSDTEVIETLRPIIHGSNPSSEIAGIDNDVVLTSHKPIDPDMPTPNTNPGNFKPIVNGGDVTSEVAGIDDNIRLLSYKPIGSGADSVPMPQNSYLKNVSPVLKGIFTYGGLGLDFLGAGLSVYDFIKAADDGEIKQEHVHYLASSIMGLGSSIMSLARGLSMTSTVMGIVSAMASIAYNIAAINPDDPLSTVDAITNSFGLGSIASSAVASKEYSDAADATNSNTEKRIYETLAYIKKLDAIPIANWFSTIYTNVELDDIKDEILSEFGGVDTDATTEEKQRALSNALRQIINEKYHEPLEGYSNELLEKTNADVVQIATLATSDDTALGQLFKDAEIPGEKLYSTVYEIKDGQGGDQTHQLYDNNYILDQQSNRTVVATEVGSSINLGLFGLDYVNNRILVVDYRNEELRKLYDRLRQKGTPGEIRTNDEAALHSAEYESNEGSARVDLNIQATDFYKGMDSKIYAPLNDVMKTKVTFGSGNDNLKFSKIERVSGDSSRLVSTIAHGGEGYDSVSLEDIPETSNKVYEFKYFAESNVLKSIITPENPTDIILDDFENIFLPGENAINKVSLHGTNSYYRKTNLITINGESASRNEIDFRGLTGMGLRFIGTHKGNLVNGTEENDELYATLTQDDDVSYGTSTLHGFGGADKIIGSKGADFLYGDDGDDVIHGNMGADTVEGGKGDDRIYYYEGMAKVDGGEGNDILNLSELKEAVQLTSTLKDAINFDATGFEGVVGTKFNDTLHAFCNANSTLVGGMGNDTIVDNDHEGYLMGSEGNDTIDGNGGDDTILGGIGSDTIHGGTGNDKIFAGLYSLYKNDIYGENTVYGEEGEDTIYGDSGVDNIYGGSENDYLNGRVGNDLLKGGEGEDVLEDLSGSNRLYGEAGDDTIRVASNNEIIDGGEGIDKVDYSKVSEEDGGITLNLLEDKVTLKNVENRVINIENAIGTNSSDTITGNNERNNLEGRAGNDKIYGRGGNDFILGETGDDTLYGEEGSDTLSGGSGIDILHGGNGDDRLKGDSGNDTLYGGAGIDTLIGGIGSDTLYGGEGRDSFVLTRNFEQDTIKDYSSDDRIVFDITTGISSLEDITFQKQEDSLILKQSTSNRVVVENYFNTENNDLNINIGDTAVNQNDINEKINSLTGGIPADAILGDDTSNVLHGNGEDNVIYGFKDVDVLYGESGNDEIYGGEGRDSIYGGDGNDYIYGETGRDGLQGQNGDDHIFGGEGDDTLEGNSGNDTLYGGLGDDQLRGDEGIDTFVFGKDFGNDTIYATYKGLETQDILVFEEESGVSSINDLQFTKRMEWNVFNTAQHQSLIISTGNNSIKIKEWDVSGYNSLNMQIGGENITANINSLVS
ncbi:calcium-binding protein [Clostridium oceanicum]|uniref:Bifunctional hemolysin/adenylate cyclase n=1 Tax=Clostridium oceanicum TaxID=1543 RepID=A0ABN1JCY6_9CLOT